MYLFLNVGLDIVPFSRKANLESIFGELAQLYFRRESIPDNNQAIVRNYTRLSCTLPELTTKYYLF